jgi:hypothetical protein
MVDLDDYRKTVSEDTWRVWNDISGELKKKDLKVTYFNSTPQGGGGNKMKKNRSLKLIHAN